jgi:hypothetical protein
MDVAQIAGSRMSALVDLLRHLHRGQRRWHLLRGAAILAIVLGAAVPLLLVGDRTWLLPPWVRLVLLAALVVAVGWTAWATWRRLQRYDAVRLALQVEALRPGMSSLLVSAVQFAQQPPSDGADPQLVGLVQERAEAAAGTCERTGLVPWRRLRRLGAVAAAALVAVGALAAWRPHDLAVLAQRMVNPFSAMRYPSATTVVDEPGDVLVAVGEDARIEVRLGGVLPAQAQLWLRPTGQDWVDRMLPVAADGRCTVVLPTVRGDIDYRLVAGDVATSDATVRVVQPPRLTQTRVTLAYPAYVRREAQTLDTMHLSVPEGTRIRWELELDRAVEGARLVFDGGAEVEPLAGAGAGLVFRSEATASGGYGLRFRWRLGGRTFDHQGTPHILRVLPDQPPQVTLELPAEDGKATRAKRAMVRWRAEDDHGLSAASLVWSLNGGAEQRQALADPAGGTLAWAIRDAIPDVRVGDLVTLAVEVADTRERGGTAAAHTARSRSRRIQIVDDAAYLREQDARQRRLLGRLLPLYDQTLAGDEALRDITMPEAGR